MRQQQDDVNRRREGQQSADKEYALGTQVRQRYRPKLCARSQQEVDERRAEDPYEREQIGSSQYATFFVSRRAMLQDRIHRHDEKSTEESQAAEQPRDRRKPE